MSYSVVVTYQTPSGNKTVGTNSSKVDSVTSNLQSKGYKIIKIEGQGAGKNVVAPAKAAVPSAQVNKESTTIYEAGTPIGKELEAPAAPPSFSTEVTYQKPSGEISTVGTNISRLNTVTTDIQNQGSQILKIEAMGAGKNVVGPIQQMQPDAQYNKTSTVIYEAGTPIGKSLVSPDEQIQNITTVPIPELTPADIIQQQYAKAPGWEQTIGVALGTFFSTIPRTLSGISEDVSNWLTGKEPTHAALDAYIDPGIHFQQTGKLATPSKQVAEWEYGIRLEPNFALRVVNVALPTLEVVVLPLVFAEVAAYIGVATITGAGTTAGTVLNVGSKLNQYVVLPAAIGIETGVTAAVTGGFASKETIKMSIMTLEQFGVMGAAYKYTDPWQFERFSSKVRTAYEQGLASLAPIKGISPEILLAKEPFFGEFNLKGNLSSGYNRFIGDVGSREFLGIEPQKSNLTLRGELSGGYENFIQGLSPVKGISSETLLRSDLSFKESLFGGYTFKKGLVSLAAVKGFAPEELLPETHPFGDFRQSIQIKLNMLANPETYGQLPFGGRVRTGINKILNLSAMYPSSNYEGMYTPEYEGLNLRGKLRVGLENFISDTGSTYYTVKEKNLRLSSPGLYPESEINLLEYGTSSYYKYPEETVFMPWATNMPVTNAIMHPSGTKIFFSSELPGRSQTSGIVEFKLKQNDFDNIISTGKTTILGTSKIITRPPSSNFEMEAIVYGTTRYDLYNITPSEKSFYSNISSNPMEASEFELRTGLKLPSDIMVSESIGSFKEFSGRVPFSGTLGEYLEFHENMIWKFQGKLLDESYSTRSFTFSKEIGGGEVSVPGKYGFKTKEVPKSSIAYSVGVVEGTGELFTDLSITRYPKPKGVKSLLTGSILSGELITKNTDLILPGGLSGPQALEGPPLLIEPMYSLKNIVFEETEPYIISSYWSGKVSKTSNPSMQGIINLQGIVNLSELSSESILSNINLQQNLSITNQMNLQSQKQLQIQLPIQLNLQQPIQLQQQQQVQLQLQEQEQLQLQLQQQVQLQVQIPVQVQITDNLLIETPIDIPEPNINIIIPGLPPIPPKKKKPTFDIDTDIFVMEGYQFRHKAFPVVTSDFFRKVNIKLPKVKI